MTEQQDGYSVSFPQESELLPDTNTAQAISYGPAYDEMIGIMWAWDSMEDHLMQVSQSLESQLMDRAWCYEVLKKNRYLIFARSPPVNEVQHLRDLQTLRQLCKVQAALHKIDEYRQKNIAWARMQGIKQYVNGLKGTGISESRWKASTSEWNTRPINYYNVNNPVEVTGDDFDWDEALKDLMGEKSYDKLVKSMGLASEEEAPMRRNRWMEEEDESEEDYWEEDEPEDTEDEVEDESDDEEYEDEDESEEDEDESEEDEDESIPDEPEIPIPAPRQVKRSDGITEALAVMFDDPVSELMSDAPKPETPDSVSVYLKRSDFDNRAIIDWLIECAGATARCSNVSCRSTRRPSPT